MKQNYFKFRNVKINQIEICALIGLIFSILACFFNLINTTQTIKKNILRLHILANSDSNVDQNLKIQLKNNILKNFNFDSYSNNLDIAKKKINQNLNKIETYSNNFVKKQGFNYNVKASIKPCYFKTRSYGIFSLPPGIYDSLTIEIGKATGHNWWCVFVPAMCVPAAKATQKIDKVLNKNQADLIKKGNKTEIRFAILQMFEDVKKMLI